MANVITAATQAHVETIIDAMPPYYITSNILRNILAAWVQKTDGVNADNEDLIKQLYVQTATWGLIYWENDYGITAVVGTSYEVRRANVFVKMFGAMTFTKHSAKVLANVYSRDKTAEFMSILFDYAFKTRHDIDDLIDYDQLVAAFDESKPAHLLHVVGLIIKLAMSIDEDLAFKVTERVSTLLFDVDFAKRIRIKDRAEMIGYSFIYNTELNKIDESNLVTYTPNIINYLYVDGTWNLDGERLLTGRRSDVIKLCLMAAEILIATIKSKVAVNMDIVEILKTAIQVQAAASDYVDYSKKITTAVNITVPGYTFVANTGLDQLYTDGTWNLNNTYILNGQRKDMSCTPNTVGRLYIDGTWNLDSGYVLNGQRSNQITQYAENAETLRITVRQNNSITNIDIV